MPRLSSPAADQGAALHLPLSVRYLSSEAQALASLLGLPDEGMPLILPMLWLGQSALSHALRDHVGTGYFALQEAQEFFYHRAFVQDEDCETKIILHRDEENDPARLLVTADIAATNGQAIVTLKSTLRLVAKPSTAQPPFAGAAKTRATGPIDVILPVIDQEAIGRYAALSGDDNPVHLDPVAARALGLQDTIAHGMMIMGLTQQGFTQPYAALSDDVFPLRFSCRFLLPLLTGQPAGLARKSLVQDGRFSERLTVLSDAGPHAIAQIHYQALEGRP